MTTDTQTDSLISFAQAGSCQCTKCGPDCACETCTCESCECTKCSHQG